MEDNLRTPGLHIKLEGVSNWNVWKFQSVILLRSQDLLDVVEGKSVKPEAAAVKETWEKKDARAQTWLVTRMSENVMMHIITCTTSAEMWRKLASVYEQKSETSIHIVQQRFFQYKYEEGAEMSVFLSKIEELKNQLKQMGEDISEKFVITKVLMSLPECYKHFVSAWESAPDDKQTYDNLVARLLIEQERLKERGEVSRQSSAFVANKIDKSNVKCFKCNKMGHYQSECRSNINNRNASSTGSASDNKSGKKCFYCNKSGHVKSECWFRKNKDRNSNAFVIASSSGHFQQSQWLVDTGASQHMCCERNLFTTYSALSNKSVIVGNGNAISAHGCGQVAVQVYNSREWINTTIDNVLYVPDLKTNLFSVNCATDRGYVMVTNESMCKFYKQNKLSAVANRNGEMYYLDVRYKCEVANVSQVKSVLKECHEKLAHQNFDHVKKVLEKNNIELKQTHVPQCESCLEGKIHRLPFKKSETVSTRTCEIIHGDTCGPMEEESIGGSRYFVILKDDHSNFRTVYFVKAKHEIKHCLEEFLNKAENITGNKVKTFRTDNGLEFVNKEVTEMCSKRGIIHQTTVTYTPEQNGKAERENRTLVEAARTMLHAKNLPKKLWAEAVNTAAFVLNRTGKGKEGKSPYEMWTNKSFDIHQLQAFGSPVYVHIPKEKRRKWDRKGEKGLMVGYGENVKGYRIFFPENNSVEVKRDVVFMKTSEQEEEKEQFVMLEYDTKVPQEGSEKSSVEFKEQPGDSEGEEQTRDCEESNLSAESGKTLYLPCTSDEGSSDEKDGDLSPRQKSTRVRKQTSFYTCHHVCTEDEPKTYCEAMQRKDASKWQEAVERELETLKQNNTWDFCKEGASGKTVSSKWVFKIKNAESNIQYKARLVARGFEQHDMFDLCEIYAPVAKLSTFRLFVSVATKLNLPIYQMDVTGAFLYGDIDEEVYLELPEGAYSGNNNIVKLNKSLYGLKSHQNTGMINLTLL